MNPLANILPWLKNLLGGQGGNPPVSGPPPTATPVGNPPAVGQPPVAPAGGPPALGLPPTYNPNAGGAIASLTGAEAGPGATGPTVASGAPAAPAQNNLSSYADVMRALQGLSDTPQRPRIGGGAPRAGGGGAGKPVTPGPTGPTISSSVGASLASPQGQNLIQKLQQLLSPMGSSFGAM